MQPLAVNRQTLIGARPTPGRSGITAKMEDVSFWLAIVLMLSLHSLYEPTQESNAGPTFQQGVEYNGFGVSEPSTPRHRLESRHADRKGRAG